MQLWSPGCVPIAHANDGAGSIRIRHCCGLVGLKASRDRIKDKEMPGYFPANILHDVVIDPFVTRGLSMQLLRKSTSKRSAGPIEGFQQKSAAV